MAERSAVKLNELGKRAKEAEYILASCGSKKKEEALCAIADILEKRAEEWLAANALDMEAAEKNGMVSSMLDRLKLTKERIDDIVEGVRQVVMLPDPIAHVDSMDVRPNGLIIGKKRVPLGVIGIIFEARPNVTVDAAVLCLKSGNTCILRGGKEAINSNICVIRLMREALKSVGLPEDCICLIEDTDRESARELMHLDEYIDVLIPRGGKDLIRTVAKEASVPVIRTGEGVCHIYVDDEGDLDMAAEILFNAKCQRPAVCNSVECVLIHEDVAESFLKKAVPLLDKYDVELRCDERALEILGERGIPAKEEDWNAEYDDYILAVHIVSGPDEAIAFINEHGTKHSEAIITKDIVKAQDFLERVDAAAVYVNASTRFTDGFEFGLGAEIGISTQKLHARGPMGLWELTSIKYMIYGKGQIR